MAIQKLVMGQASARPATQDMWTQNMSAQSSAAHATAAEAAPGTDDARPPVRQAMQAVIPSLGEYIPRGQRALARGTTQ